VSEDEARISPTITCTASRAVVQRNEALRPDEATCHSKFQLSRRGISMDFQPVYIDEPARCRRVLTFENLNPEDVPSTGQISYRGARLPDRRR